MDNPLKDTNDQAELFNILKDKYVLTFDFPSETSADYYHVGNVNNIDYFAPNDEDWGFFTKKLNEYYSKYPEESEE